MAATKKAKSKPPARNFVNHTGTDTKAREVVQKDTTVYYMGETFTFKTVDAASKYFDECVNNSQATPPAI